MPRDDSQSTEADSLAVARRVHAACERHEAAWRVGLRPRMEDELDRAAEGDRHALLFELLALEVELRRDLGERPTPDEYSGRFPGQRTAIAAAFESPTDVDTEGRGEETRTYFESAGQVEGGERTIAYPAGGWASPAGWAGLGPDFGDFELREEVARGGDGHRLQGA